MPKKRNYPPYPEQDMVNKNHGVFPALISEIYVKAKDERKIQLHCRIAMGMVKQMENAFAVYKDMVESHNYIFTVEQKSILAQYTLTNKVKPYPSSRMSQVRRLAPFTICDTLRTIYVTSNNPDIQYLSRVATRRAKSLAAYLQVYSDAVAILGIPVNSDIRKHYWEGVNESICNNECVE